MRIANCYALLTSAGWLALALAAEAQTRPYIGFVYPAGGQQGTTFQVKLGGQGLDEVCEVYVTGSGVSAKVLEYNRALGNQEFTLLNEQLRQLKRTNKEVASTTMSSDTPMMMSDTPMMAGDTSAEKASAASATHAMPPGKLIARLEKRVAEYVARPASAAIAHTVCVEVTIDSDAEPGERELRLGTPRGISNPLVFHVGQLPEVSRKPMVTAPLQVLGKEEQALRKRPASEVEERITLPCVLNGQIASGELNRYRFTARKGQNLVITTLARQLIPYVADAVPGWFQPVVVLYDAQGRELAYGDDYRFRPDPTLFCQIPADGEYALEVYDALYRGREDFVYRITLGELACVTSIFPLGTRAGVSPEVKMRGWNLDNAELERPAADTEPGIHRLVARKDGFVSNPLSFDVSDLPEGLEKEGNDRPARAQKVTLPIIVNGTVERPGDWDIFRFEGKSNEMVVAEVLARRLDSPLDSTLKLTDATGRLLAFNDDREDAAAGANTHHADSYLMARLPADGSYYVHLGDTAHNGGEEYGYRLRISRPRPGFALRVVPSSVAIRGKSTTTVSVHLLRLDGFTGPVKLGLKEPPAGLSATPVTISGTQAVARLTIKSDLVSSKEPLTLRVIGTAKLDGQDVTREAVPAEDRMQAFLWRHLVPAAELKALVYDPNYQPAPKRVARPRPPAATTAKAEVAATDASTNKPKFTKQQVAGRLRQLKFLFEEGLLTDDFYDEKVAECEAAQ